MTNWRSRTARSAEGRWLLTALVLRSRSLWLTIGLVFVGTALCAGFATTAASFSLSTSQQSEDQFGTADGWASWNRMSRWGTACPRIRLGR